MDLTAVWINLCKPRSIFFSFSSQRRLGAAPTGVGWKQADFAEQSGGKRGKKRRIRSCVASGTTSNTSPPLILYRLGSVRPSVGSRLSVRASSWWRLEEPNKLSEIRGGGQGMRSSPAPTRLRSPCGCWAARFTPRASLYLIGQQMTHGYTLNNALYIGRKTFKAQIGIYL